MLITAFYSDPHFFHKSIIQYCNRPFSSIEEMNEQLIERYNSKINVIDTVLWCGDSFFCSVEKAKQVMQRLNGHKILVVGNHDRGLSSMAKIGFDIVMDECVLDIEDQTFRVKHYPYIGNKNEDGSPEGRYLDRRPQKIKGEMLIHGHVHSKKKINGKQIHVGVDAWDYYPAMLDEIKDLIKK